MADFNKPTLDSEYNLYLDKIKSSIASVARMFDGTIDQNLPVGSIKFNASAKRFEKWDGTAWQAQEITGLSAGSVSGGALQADSVSGAKILLANQEYLRGAAQNGVAQNILRINTTGALEINSVAGSGVSFTQNGVMKWQFDSSYNLVPYGGDAVSIGGTSTRLHAVRAKNITNCDDITDHGQGLTVGPQTASQHLKLRAGGSTVAEVRNITGSFGLFPVGTSCVLGEGGTAFASAAINSVKGLELWNDNSDVKVEARDDYYLRLGAGITRRYWRINYGPQGNLEPEGNNVYDLGSSTNRIRVAHIAGISNCTDLYTPNTMRIGTTTSNDFTIRSGNADRWKFAPSGELLPVLSDNYKIGSSGNRVLEMFVAKISKCDDINVNGGHMRIGPTSSHDLYFRVANFDAWRVSSEGNFQPITTDTYNIGNSARRVAALSVRDINNVDTITNPNLLTIGTTVNQPLKFQQAGIVYMSFEGSSHTTRLSLWNHPTVSLSGGDLGVKVLVNNGHYYIRLTPTTA